MVRHCERRRDDLRARTQEKLLPRSLSEVTSEEETQQRVQRREDGKQRRRENRRRAKNTVLRAQGAKR